VYRKHPPTINPIYLRVSISQFLSEMNNYSWTLNLEMFPKISHSKKYQVEPLGNITADNKSAVEKGSIREMFIHFNILLL
jgi:hypothetical protein